MANEKSHRTGVVARKIGMTRVFDADGAHVPVTVLDLEGCQVIGRRTVEAEEFKDSSGAHHFRRHRHYRHPLIGRP